MFLADVTEQLRKSMWEILRPYLSVIAPIALLAVIIVLLIFAKENKEYKKGAYYQATKTPYILLLLGRYISSKKYIGRYGEYTIYKQLKRFENDGAKFLFNVYIPKQGGGTSEIDVLMICKECIFVFESKNFSGWIFGDEKSKNWVQTLPTGNKSQKEYFFNPIMQNRSHIKHLQAVLKQQIPLKSVVVFSDRCTLKSIKVESEDIAVINCSNLVSTIDAVCKGVNVDVLSDGDIKEIYDELYVYTCVDDVVKEQHIADIQSNLNSRDTMQPISDNVDSDMKCPKCGGALVVRKAVKGANRGKEFYGCSNYPKCRYIKNIE